MEISNISTSARGYMNFINSTEEIPPKKLREIRWRNPKPLAFSIAARGAAAHKARNVAW